jgi:cytochrome c biogenesis protein CcmG/thiol:disulfide interchange protein DsbE
MVISFWATWCKPCVKELNAYSDNYDDWVEETGVRLIAISIDDTRSSGRVSPYVKARGWQFEVFLDENADFKRAMNVPNVPHTFLVNGEGKIVWQHTSYVEGDEEELYEKLLELAK